MTLKLYSAVQTEIITTTEIKEHIRLDSTSISSNITVNQCILGQYYNITAALTGTAADVLGNRALVVLESYANSAGATLNVKIQESHDNITYTDWSGGAFTTVTTANDTAIQQIEYTGTQQYLNVLASVAGAQANFAVNIQEITPYSVEDTYISYLGKAAREYAEAATGRAIGQQTWTMMIDEFPSRDYIEIPKAPLLSVTSVNYIDDDGVTATMTAGSSGYYVDTDSEPGAIMLADGASWPVYEEYPRNSVQIQFMAGHTADNLPYNTRIAIMMYAGLLYKYRDQAIPDEDLRTVDRLLIKDRVWWM
jgi:uncharacterized phiE125 gp8 family phage protein